MALSTNTLVYFSLGYVFAPVRTACTGQLYGLCLLDFVALLLSPQIIEIHFMLSALFNVLDVFQPSPKDLQHK